MNLRLGPKDPVLPTLFSENAFTKCLQVPYVHKKYVGRWCGIVEGGHFRDDQKNGKVERKEHMEP